MSHSGSHSDGHPDGRHWQRTSPLAAIFYLGKVYEAVAKNLVQSLAPLAALLFASEGNLATRAGIGITAFVVITTAAAFLRYWHFRFTIKDDAVLIREGVFRKTQLDIKFDRIQAINTEQNFIFRPFKLVTLKFDTAGSSKQEGHLPAISEAFAADLKARIRSGVLRTDSDEVDAGEQAATPAAQPVLQLGPMDMVRIGLSSNRALFLLVLLGPVIDRVTENVENNIDESAVAASAAQSLWADGGGLVLLIIAGFLLALVLASIAGAFLRYHGYTLLAEHDAFRSNGGLLTRHEHSVKFAKIQTLSAMQNPVHRLFGRLSVAASQASSNRQRESSQFMIPLCELRQLPAICAEVFTTEFNDVDLDPRSSAFTAISRRYLYSRLLWTAILPVLLFGGLLLPAAGASVLLLLLWLPCAWLVIFTLYRKHGFRLSEDGMVVRRGFAGYRLVAFAYRKVQRISVTQTLPQRRRGLATMRIYLASRTLKVPYMDFATAARLRDHILYKVESSQAAWH